MKRHVVLWLILLWPGAVRASGPFSADLLQEHFALQYVEQSYKISGSTRMPQG